MYYELAVGAQDLVTTESTDESNSSGAVANADVVQPEHANTEGDSLASLGEEFWQKPGGVDGGTTEL
jgi:hypothetical protein